MKPWLQLARISNLPTVWTNVTAAWLVAGGAWGDARLFWLIFAGSLLYTGGMIMNDAADAKFDAEHRRERPIPAGKVSLRSAWIVSAFMMAAGAVLSVVFRASPHLTVFLVAAIVFYNIYHKQSSATVILMGACRVLLCLVAASAATADSYVGTIATFHLFGAERTVDFGFVAAGVFKALPYALALGCYVVGITVAARLEHQKDGTLPVGASLFAFLLLYVPAILGARRFATAAPEPLQIVILALFAMLVAYATQTLRKGGPAIGKAVGLLLAGIVIVDALAVSTVSVPLAFAFAALAPVLRIWQRWIAAT